MNSRDQHRPYPINRLRRFFIQFDKQTIIDQTPTVRPAVYEKKRSEVDKQLIDGRLAASNLNELRQLHPI